MYSLIKLVLVVSSGMVMSSAFAHGTEKHGDMSNAEVKMEQTDWGIAGQAKAAKRVIHIRMLDTMRFAPDHFTVKQGETVKLVIHNSGKMLHEFVIGTTPALKEHAALMVKFPDMQHDEPYMAHVPPGKTETLHWQFNRAGEFAFACLIAGHYQSGMKGKIKVIASKPAKHDAMHH